MSAHRLREPSACAPRLSSTSFVVAFPAFWTATRRCPFFRPDGQAAAALSSSVQFAFWATCLHLGAVSLSCFTAPVPVWTQQLDQGCSFADHAAAPTVLPKAGAVALCLRLSRLLQQRCCVILHMRSGTLTVRRARRYSRHPLPIRRSPLIFTASAATTHVDGSAAAGGSTPLQVRLYCDDHMRMPPPGIEWLPTLPK